LEKRDGRAKGERTQHQVRGRAKRVREGGSKRKKKEKRNELGGKQKGIYTKTTPHTHPRQQPQEKRRGSGKKHGRSHIKECRRLKRHWNKTKVWVQAEKRETEAST